MSYKTNIEEETIENENYRNVLYTGEHIQLVVMSLKPNEEIPFEVHESTDQFIRVEQGAAEVTIDDKKFNLEEDEVIIIPAGSRHRVCNIGDYELKIYTIYSPPEHPAGTVHKTKEEADAAEH